MVQSSSPISICLLVRNERDRLPACLEPLRGFAELLVYDSGSEDGSPELCRQFGARVESGSWLGFAASRRRLFEMAGQPWILWLDADEVVSPALREELFAAVADPGDKVGFWLNRQVVFNGRRIAHGEWFPDWNLRLFRRAAWSISERRVHESVSVDGPTGRLDNPLAHYSYRDWADRERRARAYAELWAEQAADEGRKGGRLIGWGHGMARFLRGYLWKRGFLDGRLGWRIAVSNAREAILKYRLLAQAGRGQDGQ